MDILIAIIISTIATGSLVYLILRRQIKRSRFLDEKVQIDNEKLQQKNQELQAEYVQLVAQVGSLESAVKNYTLEAERTKENIVALGTSLAQEQLDASLQKEREKYLRAADNCRHEYEVLVEEYSENTQASIIQMSEFKEEIKKQIDEERQKLERLEYDVRLAQELARREEERKIKDQFYRIVLSDEDLQEVQNLRSVGTQLRDTLPLNKIIWECYYKQPTSALISRVVGANTKCGIYRITNTLNGRCYIGQSVNIADRFRAHIKCGLGIDAPHNKLYTTMQTSGVENFTFEIIEECSRELLNEREKFWIAYYQSDSVGLNSTKGNN